ncbi:MAG: sulfotransferase domain-containing protein, partial [Mycobacterium sp.]|nr:sulfotransferase domain-containing protein [Mycobacterium sp.]
FLDALAAEDDRIGDVEDRLRTDPHFHSYAHEQLSYARQSEYVSALEEWYARYPADRILVLASEDYYRDPQASLDRAVEFLGLPLRPIASGAVRNAAAGDQLDPEVRAKLAAHFAPYNERLEKLTGQSFPWT